MKDQKPVATRIIFALILAGFFAMAVAPLRAQPSDSIASDEALSIETLSQEDLREAFAQIKKARGQRLEGSWVVTVTPVVPPGVPQPPSFRAYASFARGGASVGSDRTRPLASPQHGTWAHIRGDEFASTTIQDLFDVMGNFQGTLTVRVKSTLIGKDEFVGVANGESRDAAGNLISSRCATVRGQRITIEPLAPQCQTIPFPQ
jgi:hypothetical protein